MSILLKEFSKYGDVARSFPVFGEKGRVHLYPDEAALGSMKDTHLFLKLELVTRRFIGED